MGFVLERRGFVAEELDLLRRITPQEEYQAGQAIYQSGGVHPIEEENGMLRYAVDGDPRRVVRVGSGAKLSGRCTCDFFCNVHRPCRHLAAAIMAAVSTGAIEEMRRRRARENAYAPYSGFAVGAALLARDTFRNLKHSFDATEIGGAPLLGVEGAVIKAHGNSNARAIFCAIRQARCVVEGGVVDLIREEVARLNVGEEA